ncbi:short-chain dehydrogenase [Penicillium chermesinum]|uniref:Short-chain dehydrogenase n=1 Tax=Penicillium chermesinum TaxID=63820 RepID=A0A9W9TJY1_9EURO|nr:short-chain dehydrogenase [Penicillium chermesinum]KAJ5225587.1 short-chain dehydrogenase [Penicillium chermesinum]KAJ6161194.1 short-chain dehydrogenase [Penicillium chermesinum]
MSSFGFDTTADEVASICSSTIRGKTVLITGASPNSLAAEFALSISKHAPGLIILAGRSAAKNEQTAAEIKKVAPDVSTRFLQLDLGSMASIRESAKEVNGYTDVDHIDVLMNSAGIMAGPYAQTADGIEAQFGTNHLGHFLFTNLIMDKLVSADGSKPSRVVNVTSMGHQLSPIRFQDWNFDDGKAYDQWFGYGQSKTANMLFSRALAARYASKGLTSVSVHPGAILTNLVGSTTDDDWAALKKIAHSHGLADFKAEFKFKTFQQGAATQLFAAFHDSVLGENNGKYLFDCQVIDDESVISWARDPIDAEHLWRLSEEIVGQQFGP